MFAVPVVAEGVPVDGFGGRRVRRVGLGVHGELEGLEIELPAGSVVVGDEAGVVAVGVLVEACFAGFAIAPGGEDGAGVIVEELELGR